VSANTAPAGQVDRLIVHQFDPARPSPGGIDTCLRGLLKYLPDGLQVAVVGVDTGSGPRNRRLGCWEQHQLGGTSFWFLPVARLDPADQARRMPHSVRLLAGLLRYRGRLPAARLVQVHRMDSALVLRTIFRRPQAYFIHTQAEGLTGRTSDSFWRFAGGLHGALERRVVRLARNVTVFNEDYAEVVRTWNPAAEFSPTWYDPALVRPEEAGRDPYKVVWTGRLEVPKDPELAIRSFAELALARPGEPWSLDLLGAGTLMPALQELVASLPEAVRRRVALRGRVAPADVAQTMGSAGTFLMTSHPGYEGYPRVLVEAMASGLPAVVTFGSDTGGLVKDARTGFVCTRSPQEIAARIAGARGIGRRQVRAAVEGLQAPVLVERILAPVPA
jgi:glycosyltransferase involved in cell wall biosynthesis